MPIYSFIHGQPTKARLYNQALCCVAGLRQKLQTKHFRSERKEELIRITIVLLLFFFLSPLKCFVYYFFPRRLIIRHAKRLFSAKAPLCVLISWFCTCKQATLYSLFVLVAKSQVRLFLLYRDKLSRIMDHKINLWTSKIVTVLMNATGPVQADAYTKLNGEF